MATAHLDDDERRARLGVRHALVERVADPVAATRAVGVLHATEPATVLLSLQARVEGLTVAAAEATLHDERSLVRQLAMRRTLFVFPRDLLPAAWGSASRRVLGAEGRRIAQDVVLAGFHTDGEAWLAEARARIVAELESAGPDGLTAGEIRERLPDLARQVAVRPGSVWNHGRLLTHLGLDATVVRGVNTGHWRVSRPRWTLARHWLGEVPAPLPEAEGYRALVRVWLERFGPGTLEDLVWWLGATKGAVRTALATLGAVEVSTSAGPAFLLPDDPWWAGERLAASTPPWAALLPVLDPTVMGWRQRDWYLGEHAPALFDRTGNAGTTAWWCGRVVGCWVQDDAGAVEVRPLEALPAEARHALVAEAERLTRWLDGTRIGTVYPSSAMKADPRDLPYPGLRA